MQYTTSWKEEGRQEGRQEGLQEGLATASRRGLKFSLDIKFGEAASPLIARLPDCPLETLERLQDALEAKADLQQFEKLLPNSSLS